MIPTKAPRCLFLLACLACVPLFGGEAEDAKLMQQLREKQKEFMARLLATEDMNARAAIIQEQRDATAKIVSQLGEPSRTALTISLKIVEPIQQHGAAYLKQVGAASQKQMLDFATLRSRDEIPERRKTLEQLEQANQELLARITRVDQDLTAELDHSPLSAKQRRDFRAGFERGFGRTVGPTKAIRNLDATIWGKLKEILALLESHWGEWQVEDGAIQWKNESIGADFAKLQTEIGEAADRQSRAEQELARRI